MRKGRYFIIISVFISAALCAGSQRVYTAHSVLSTGSWYKISVSKPGIYRIDLPFLNNLGVNTAALASSSIRLFGNGGMMLPEANGTARTDDLEENDIQVIDGGDGIFNGSDYLLFYAGGPDQWIKDSLNSSFRHIKNIYSDQSFYYLNIGSNGKRIADVPLMSSAAVSVTSFSERYFHENDSVNFLAGSKEWYGEELSTLPGRSPVKNFSVNIPGIMPNSPIRLRSSLVSRSAGMPSRYDVRINNILVAQPQVNAVGAGQYDLFAQAIDQVSVTTATQSPVEISYTYVPGSFNAQGWINWFEIGARRKLSMNAVDQLLFRDWTSVGNPQVNFILQDALSSTQVWDVTNPLHPLRVQGSLVSNEFRFVNSALSLHEYIGFNPNNFLNPVAVGKIVNQDLHQASPVDFLVITHPLFVSEANRLVSIHQQKDGLRGLVVTTEQIYNEFSAGSPDPAAIRDFIKMYHDKYGSNPADKPKYLLLFGDASYDYKERIKNNTNLVPAFQNDFSLDPLSTYTSDDFFGFLDDQEDINSGLVFNLLDIGIGRVPVKNIQEAKDFTDKVESYLSAKSFGPWRNNLTLVADDEDNNLHLQDAEAISATSALTAPEFNQQKIYLDAFRQESGAGGSSYPAAVLASNNQVLNGTLIWNYNGHGGARRLAEETILDQQMSDQWNNSNRLPLFITATCDFAPYDNPALQSLGENILLKPKSGAIALMTTTRVVFSFSNRIMNDNYLRIAMQRDGAGNYKRLGDAVREAKNYTYQTSPDITNNRKFTLLGDPALRLGFPYYNVQVSSVNGKPANLADTLSSGEVVSIEGVVRDLQGNILQGFNGNVYPVIFDKPTQVRTLGNDAGSPVTGFTVQNSILFKGVASVNNGLFRFSFKVPLDINLQYGNGRISLYATDSIQDGNGLFTNLFIGGTGQGMNSDHEGPEIKAWLNDEFFVNGGLVNQSPSLLLELSDSSGINTSNNSIGHEILATLDNDNRNYFILNDFYQAKLNSYQEGTVRFQLPDLSPGNHNLKIRAWDVLNNSSEKTVDFTVASDEDLEISHVLNYPNPFTSRTSFWFEHNKPGEPLEVGLQIMTIAGRVIRSFRETITTTGNRSEELNWDGRDEAGDKAGRGVYIYELSVKQGGKKAKKLRGKLVLL